MGLMADCEYCDKQATVICDECKADAVCDSHTSSCSKCDRKLCQSCIEKCVVCGELLCGNDMTNCWTARCEICDRHKVCKQCGSECMHGRWVCTDCRDADTAGNCGGKH